MSMERLDLDAIEARVGKATRGPWKHDPVYDEVYSLDDNGAKNGVCCTWSSDGEVFHGVNQDNDGDFIAHARDDIPALVARVRELEMENADLRARLEAVRARCEANNWMGTARLCGGESELTTSPTHTCDAISASS